MYIFISNIKSKINNHKKNNFFSKHIIFKNSCVWHPKVCAIIPITLTQSKSKPLEKFEISKKSRFI